MREFKNGVSWYLKGEIQIEVSFPEGKVKCQYCRFCRAEKDLERFWCRLTNQMIYEPFVEGLPDGCPVQLTGEITGKKEN